MDAVNSKRSWRIGIFVQIFAGFWLALLLMGVSSWALFTSYTEMRPETPWIDSKPWGQRAVASAVRIAQLAGREGLIEWLKDDRVNTITIAYAVNDQNQEISGRQLPPGTLKSLENPSFAPAITSLTLNGEHLRIFALRPARPPANILITFWRQPTWVQLLLALLATSAVAALLAFYYTSPIRKLHRAMKKTAEGDFQFHLSSSIGHRYDELGELAAQYDEMATKLSGLINGQKRLFHDVSHELRSPLARMEIAVGLADKDPHRAHEMLSRIEHEIAVLDGLVDELLTFARLDDAVSIHFERTDIVPVLEGITDNANFEGTSRQVKVQLQAPQELFATINLEAFSRAVENLVRNALRFSPSGSCVDVTAAASSEQLTITVRDAGPGMPADILQKVFMPFYRGPGEKTGTGFGLGLAIAKRAIERHGGTLTARNGTPHGLVMTISLPVTKTTAD